MADAWQPAVLICAQLHSRNKENYLLLARCEDLRIIAVSGNSFWTATVAGGKSVASHIQCCIVLLMPLPTLVVTTCVSFHR